MKVPFQDRAHAGRELARALAGYAQREDVTVLGLPRGGVPVALEVARALNAPLDVFVVRKIGLPGYEELAMGAIASGGARVLNEEVITQYGITETQFHEAAGREEIELRRREHLFRDGRTPAPTAGRVCILVDDGLATGSTMRAAIAALRRHRPREIIVAVPVGAESTCRELEAQVDTVVCLFTPEPFIAVGRWYRDFAQTTDEQVQGCLAEAAKRVH